MKKIVIGSILLISMIVFALFFSSFSLDVDMSKRLSPPEKTAPWGYDEMGRSLIGEVAAGVLVSLGISISVMLISVALGLLVAFLMSMGGALLAPAVILSDSLKVVPPVIIALFLASISGPGSLKVIVALSISNIPNIARTLYTKISVIYKEGYVEVSEGFGMGRVRIFFSHVLKKLWPYIGEQALSIISSAILTEASLSYLGCGLKITTPSLGSILASARGVMMSAGWMVFYPATALFILGLSFVLLLHGLKEIRA